MSELLQERTKSKGRARFKSLRREIPSVTFALSHIRRQHVFALLVAYCETALLLVDVTSKSLLLMDSS